MSVVLDSSAVLAWLQSEPGSERVRPLIDGGVIAAPNWSEVLQKVQQHGRDMVEVGHLLRALGIDVEPVSAGDAEAAARLWSDNPALSLADRLCLAVARRLRVPAATADQQWAQADLKVDVRLVR